MMRSLWPRAPACCTSPPPNCWPTRTSSACSWAPRRSLFPEVAQDHLYGVLAPLGMGLGGLHIVLEDQRERVLVGDVEYAQRADRGVDVDRVQARPEQPLLA